MIFFDKLKDYETFASDIDAPKCSESQEIFLTHWLKRCGDKEGYIPARAEFSPVTFAKHMHSVVVFDVLSNPLDFHYRLFGTTVREYSSEDFTGKRLSSLPGKGPDSHIWNFLNQTRLKGVPFYKMVPYVGPSVRVKHSTIMLLPMANDHKTVDKLFLVTNFVL